MKKFRTVLLTLLFVNVFTIHAQLQSTDSTTKKVKTSASQELYNDLNEKSKNPLLVINGFLWGNDTTILQIINPNEIKSLDVVKDKAARDFYGENGKNGVLMISLKDKSITSLDKFKTVYGLHSSNSKEQKVSGIIYDSNKNPIPNAFISNLNRKESFKSNSEGKYELTARENDVLVFFLSGFKSKIVKIKDVKMDVILEANPKSEIMIR